VISPFVIECIGVKAFKRAAISGMRISAEQALHWGLLSHLAEEDTLNQSTEKLTQQLLQNGPEAMAATKQLAHDVAYREIGPQTKQHTSHLIASMRGSIEGREGISAFLEKRSAAWKVSL
jgi:methylglutaconyl-CoA hydratase